MNKEQRSVFRNVVFCGKGSGWVMGDGKGGWYVSRYLCRDSELIRTRNNVLLFEM